MNVAIGIRDRINSNLQASSEVTREWCEERRSLMGVGRTRLIASHGAGKGGTMKIIARWPTPRPAGRDQSGPYAFIAMLVSLNLALVGQNQFDPYDMKLRVVFLSNHSWNTLRVLIPESSHPSKTTHHQPIPHHCGADHTPYPSAEQ